MTATEYSQHQAKLENPDDALVEAGDTCVRKCLLINPVFRALKAEGV